MKDLTVRIPAGWLKTALVGLVTAAVAFPAGALASQTLGDRFDDVDADDTHAEAVGWLADAEVTAGCTPDEYCPDQPVTREQMATFMRRLAGGDGEVAPVVVAATAGEASTAGWAEDADTLQGMGPDELTADLSDRLDDLEGEVADLQAANAELEGELAEVQQDNEQLTALLAGVERVEVDDHDTLRFEGMNVQVVNGSGSTDGAPDGLGNLIIGYHDHGDFTRDRDGSHYLIVGDQHSYTSFGGIVAGLHNTASGEWATVTGGWKNTASGDTASVVGGRANRASGARASVTGGGTNAASFPMASVTGGEGNEAAGLLATVSGGEANVASGISTSVAGGRGNLAGIDPNDPDDVYMWATVAGGMNNTATGVYASVAGGRENRATGTGASVSGGGDPSAAQGNHAEGTLTSILGGANQHLDTAGECLPDCS